MDLPCCIEQLPSELLLDIFEFLPWRNLRSATLVCSRWNSLIGSSSKLMNNLTLSIGRKNNRDRRDISTEYDNYLSRSVRHYRKMAIRPHDERSFAVAVLAVRKFGPHLRELSLKADDMKVMPYSRMKELDMGLDEDERIAWEQELDSLDRCLLPIDEYKVEVYPIHLSLYEQLCCRQIEEIFYATTYRYCSRLSKLSINYYSCAPHFYLKRFSLYEGLHMEHLKELEIHQCDHLVLAKSTSLRKFKLFCVITGPPLYASLGHTFPLLTHLEIKSTSFDDSSLWAISQHCHQLEDLSLSSYRITQHGFRYVHQLQQLRKLRIQLGTVNWECTFDLFVDLPLEDLTIACNAIKVETIHRMLEINANMKRCKITARRYTYAGDEIFPLSLMPELREMRPSCEITLS